MANPTSRLEELERLLKDAERAYRAVSSGERVSGQAVAALLKRREDLTREIWDLREQQADLDAQRAEADMTDDELVERSTNALLDIPETLFDRIMAGVVEGGRETAVRRALPTRLRIVGED